MTRKYYAKINSNNEVIKVVVGDETFLDTFIDDSPGKWLECCKRTHAGVYFDPETQRPAADQSKAFRKNFPRIGDTYDASRDAFVFKQPYPSWFLMNLLVTGILLLIHQDLLLLPQNMFGMKKHIKQTTLKGGILLHLTKKL